MIKTSILNDSSKSNEFKEAFQTLGEKLGEFALLHKEKLSKLSINDLGQNTTAYERIERASDSSLDIYNYFDVVEKNHPEGRDHPLTNIIGTDESLHERMKRVTEVAAAVLGEKKDIDKNIDTIETVVKDLQKTFDIKEQENPYPKITVEEYRQLEKAARSVGPKTLSS